MSTSSTKRFSIKQAAAELNLSEVYIRRMIQNGKLPTIKTQVGDTEIWRHEIDETTLAKWRSSAQTRTSRNDGRGKYTIYLTKAELARMQSILAEAKMTVPFEKANKPEDVKRRYAQQKARRAAKKAAAKLAAKVPVAKQTSKS